MLIAPGFVGELREESGDRRRVSLNSPASVETYRGRTPAAVGGTRIFPHAAVGAEGDLRFLAPEGTIVAALH